VPDTRRAEPSNHSDISPQSAESDDDEKDCDPAIRILRERKRGGIKEFFCVVSG